MTDYPRVALVSAPDTSATVRFDFQADHGAAHCQVNADGFSVGAPTLDSDPLAVGDVWGYRTLTWTPRLTGTKAAALAALSAMSRELLRSENWLLFQLDAATDPVWFKVYKSPPQPLSLDEVDVDGRNPDAWQTTLALTADAFAYGERVTGSALTFGSSLSATNPLQVNLPALKGEAPTPLRVTLTPSTGDFRGVRLACIASDTAVTSPVVDIGAGDGFSAGSGTASGVSNAAALGGSWRVVTIGTGANLLLRLSGTVTPPAGRYKVLLRCEADPINSTLSNRYTFTFGQSVETVATYGPTTVIDTPSAVVGSTTPFRGWVDLGDFTFPRNADTPPDLSPAQPATTWFLKIGTPAGVAGTVRMDALKFVPIDGPTIRTTTLLRTTLADSGFYLLSSAAYAINWDGDAEVSWKHTVSSGALLADAAAHQISGSYVCADPAASQNLLIVLPDDTASSATGVWTVVASYHPRYLHIGDGT